VAITAILDLQLKTDSLETAHDVLHATLTSTRAFPGCLGVTVLVDSGDPAHVVVYETWESIEHDRAYRGWRASAEGKAHQVHGGRRRLAAGREAVSWDSGAG
jgi:heme oxygenase (mycobilin-producing)